MGTRVWDCSEDGKIEYVSLNPEFLQGALNVLRGGFFPHESASVAVDLAKHPDAMTDLEDLSIGAAKDGVSVVAIEKSTKKVVGVAFNKLQVKNDPGEESFYDKHAKSCKHPASRGLIKFMMDVDATVDLFEQCNINCLLEVMFLAILPEFRKRGIGKKLCEISMRVAKSLNDGENVKQAVEIGKSLPLEPVPQIVSALFTSPTSQKIGRALKWEIVARSSYEEHFHEGRSYASVLGKDNPCTTLEFTRI
ncbi:uncharacterized protein LOC108913973 [Anoplophora glabripennis]|uniref:uncharacterized protein LOC108913973 n=1 Tax=Anoplophora glabripennis TaxID=217634 RepID=UPI0008751647|nr:uncharacterized protein LOC108913973 [Anoplophora glabripennis]XP_018575163.1 uncharacterized protein LOC108913973 [Anoplophora glabripennis]XP_018575164.1 uncharacterized protein LOC108913973 [Anoplophora glabripennis]